VPLLLAPSRAARPHDVAGPPSAGGCPFCPGNEAETPPETFAVRPGGGPENSPGWRVRAFPNKFPAVAGQEGLHEVVVNTPRHVLGVADLTDDEAARAVGAWAGRLAAAFDDPRRLWAFLFLNQGAAAGASLQHTHAQLVGLPFAPPSLLERERAFAAAERCPICADLRDARPHRLVLERDGLVAWSPAAPALTGLVRIAPVGHQPGWDADLDAAAVGRMLRTVSGLMDGALRARDQNLWLHQRRPGGDARYHWHVDAVPRVGTLAGLELGADVIPIAVDPRGAAARLRERAAAELEPEGGAAAVRPAG
jgi:UDPglucose--hexose-1-phosphate uridylyltransferase